MDETTTPAETAEARKPYEKPQIATENLREAFQASCQKCQVITGPPWSCPMPDVS
jgi:hypothetical protein